MYGIRFEPHVFFCILFLQVRTPRNKPLNFAYWILREVSISITQDLIQKAMSCLCSSIPVESTVDVLTDAVKQGVIVLQECSRGVSYHQDSMKTKPSQRWVALPENSSSSHHVLTIFQFHQRSLLISLPPVWPVVSMPVAQCAVCLFHLLPAWLHSLCRCSFLSGAAHRGARTTSVEFSHSKRMTLANF